METQTIQVPRRVTPVSALDGVLEQLELAVLSLNGDTYRARPAAGVSGSIGEHVRHCLDHVSALITASPASTLTYDSRERGTAVERDLNIAAQRIAECRRALHAWGTRWLDEPVRVSSTIAASGETVSGWSTLGRELAFVLSHTIHHQALIAVLLSAMGRGVPDRFGYAPSTPRPH